MPKEGDGGVMDLHPSMHRDVDSSGAGEALQKSLHHSHVSRAALGLLQGDTESAKPTFCTAHE